MKRDIYRDQIGGGYYCNDLAQEVPVHPTCISRHGRKRKKEIETSHAVHARGPSSNSGESIFMEKSRDA